MTDVDFEELLAAGEDTPTFAQSDRVVIDEERTGDLIAAIRVVSYESDVTNVRVEFELTLCTGHQDAEVVLEFNPPGAGWIRHQLTRGEDPLVRTFTYRHSSRKPTGFYWHLWAREGTAREDIGSRGQPLTLRSQEQVARP